jgi:hypothetical protein
MPNENKLLDYFKVLRNPCLEMGAGCQGLTSASTTILCSCDPRFASIGLFERKWIGILQMPMGMRPAAGQNLHSSLDRSSSSCSTLS